jgi:hypothetical protein
MIDFVTNYILTAFKKIRIDNAFLEQEVSNSQPLLLDQAPPDRKCKKLPVLMI